MAPFHDKNCEIVAATYRDGISVTNKIIKLTRAGMNILQIAARLGYEKPDGKTIKVIAEIMDLSNKAESVNSKFGQISA